MALLDLGVCPYYQVKGKSLNDNTNAMIKFIKQTAIEVGYTYGKRRIVQMRLHSIARLDRSETCKNIHN
jgi:hypothetical protein